MLEPKPQRRKGVNPAGQVEPHLVSKVDYEHDRPLRSRLDGLKITLLDLLDVELQQVARSRRPAS